MANPVVTLTQPTTYAQMLNYLLPTKQTGSTTYVPRMTIQWVCLLVGLLLTGICHAQACRFDAIPPTQKPVLYEVQDHKLWRHETQTGKQSLVKGIDDVQTVAQSVLNCINPSERSHEANMVVVSKTDGSVWIRGVIWNYRNNECVVGECNHPKGPQRMLNTKGQWKQIPGFKDVLKVATGETWIAALTQSRQVVAWGVIDGDGSSLGTNEELKSRVPLLNQTPLKVFVFPAYRDILAFNGAVYGLMTDGQVTAWANDYICRIAEHRKTIAYSSVCPFVYPQQGNVERIWQTPGNPEECNASFVDGQLWQWPCDLRTDGQYTEPPIVPDRIRKSRVITSPVPRPALPVSSASTPTLK